VQVLVRLLLLPYLLYLVAVLQYHLHWSKQAQLLPLLYTQQVGFSINYSNQGSLGKVCTRILNHSITTRFVLLDATAAAAVGVLALQQE
jgi:hypothetical protein